MAFAHNAMLRGINAIYLQAPNVRQPADVADLLFFAKAWTTWISHHHHLEETRMFPGFEKVAKVDGLLQGNVDQHHTFEPGLARLLQYAISTSPEDFSAAELRAIIDSFAAALRQHLAEEITTLLALRPYNGPALLAVYQECEASASDQPKTEVFPMVLGLCDKTFQGGNSWPEMPWYAPYMVDWIFGWTHRGAWRFLPSNIHGQPRKLVFGKL